MQIEKYKEKVKIFNHYTNYKGRLFVKTLCDLFNDVAEKQTELLGIDIATLNAAGTTWMLHRLHIRLNKMPAQNEEVYIETWPSGIRRLFALRDYRMVRSNGEELVRATSEWMYIDLNRRRPLRQMDKVVEMSRSIHTSPLKMESILEEKTFHFEVQDGRYFDATFDNIDFNGHVTQASYMRWITNSLPFQFLMTHILIDVEVIYEHEIMPDSKIYSSYAMEEQEGIVTVYHRVQNEIGTIEHCIAKSVWECK